MSMDQQQTFEWLAERSNRLEKAEQERDRLAAACAEIREALEYLDEWQYWESLDTGGCADACPWCCALKVNGHTADCIRQKALSSNPGQTLLDELERLRKENAELDKMADETWEQHESSFHKELDGLGVPRSVNNLEGCCDGSIARIRHELERLRAVLRIVQDDPTTMKTTKDAVDAALENP